MEWYRPRRAAYPWRSSRPDPYRILVSEIMLQQTQVARVVSPYRAFIRRFPTLRHLAVASRREVLGAWAGLGYNRRALALSQTARSIVRLHGGRVPSEPGTLRTLPGVGPYTAAAVASLAYGVPVPAIDTNVARVLARAVLGRESHEVGRKTLRRAASDRVDRADPGGWNQALMDLGREVCRPVPRCPDCPLFHGCRFRREGRRSRPARRVQDPFEGSFRQVRGKVIRALQGDDRPMTVRRLSRATGLLPQAIGLACEALGRDGLVHAGPAAVSGSPHGRVRLPD